MISNKCTKNSLGRGTKRESLGYLLIEVLLSLLLFSVAFSSWTLFLRQAVMLTQRSEEWFQFQKRWTDWFFKLESGLESDGVMGDSDGPLGGGFFYKTASDPLHPGKLTGVFRNARGKVFFSTEFFLSEAPVS